MPVIKSPFLDDIIKGWNEKLSYNNNDLSNLVPFVQLYVLYDAYADNVRSANDSLNVRNSAPIAEHLRNSKRGDIIEVIVKDENKFGIRDYYYVGVEMGKLESQIQSSNTKGGVGIESIKVNRGTRESFLSKYDMEVVITDPSIFKEQIEYTSMYSLNQNFLIIHGWSSKSMSSFIKPPSVEGKKLYVNLNDNHKGYWSSAIVSLQKFRFSLDQQSHLRCNLTFLSSVLSKLTFKRTSEFAKKTLKDLQTPSFVNDPEIDSTDIDRLKDAIYASKNKRRTETGLSWLDEVYITPSARMINIANTALNSIGQTINSEIKKEVGFDAAAAARSANHIEEWVKIDRSDAFKNLKVSFINNKNIEFKPLEFHITGTTIVDRKRARRDYFNDWYNGFQWAKQTSSVVLTLSELRDILTYDGELNKHVVYGAGLVNYVTNSGSFKKNNHWYDPAAMYTQQTNDEILTLPKNTTLTTKVYTTRIRELHPPTALDEHNRLNESHRRPIENHPRGFHVKAFASDGSEINIYIRKLRGNNYVVVNSDGSLKKFGTDEFAHFTDEFGNEELPPSDLPQKWHELREVMNTGLYGNW